MIGGMIVLLQDVRTQRFMGHDSKWVESADNARNFHASVAAFDTGKTAVSGPFRVVFYFPDARYAIDVMDGEGIRPTPPSATASLVAPL
jgi:hypothetical protein